MYIDTLHCLRNAVGRKRSEKWRTNIWFLFRYNAPAHWSFLVKDFLAKNNVTTLGHSQYSIYLISADFYLHLDWNKNWRDLAVVMILTSFRMRRNIWKGFQKMASKNVSKIFQSLEAVYSCTRGLFRRNGNVWKLQYTNAYMFCLPRRARIEI